MWRARTGYPLGGPGFLAPELVTGESGGDPAGDLFSFGAVVAFAATGRVPAPLVTATPAGGVAEAAPTTDLLPDRASTTAEMQAVPPAGPDLGPLRGPFRDIVLACLAVEPAQRPTATRVQEVLAALEASGAPTEAVAPELGPHAPRAAGSATGGVRRWSPIVVAGAIGAAVAIVAVLVLGNAAGWFGGGQRTPRAAPTPSAPPPPPPGITTVVNADLDDSYGAGVARFASPTGNIACSMSGAEARCDLAQNSWELPPRPADCAGEFGTGAVLAGTEAGKLSCVSDTLVDPSLKVLDYGTAVRLGTVVCASRETGVRCEDDRTRHGFQVARADYELF